MNNSALAISVTYGQLAVFCSSLQQPFNAWEQRHLGQGFTWRHDSVSFLTLDNGKHLVKVTARANPCEVANEADRAIEVPFEVTEDIEIASIADTVQIELPKGLYQLRYELFKQSEDESFPVHITFIQSLDPKFRILKADGEINVTDNFLLEAVPARE